MLAATPIYALNSGPSLAPLAGKRYAKVDTGADMVIVTDSGGTSCDVSLVRRGDIPWTAEAWIGSPFGGHMVGLPAVEVHCIGAGGGSIAKVDEAGLLSVGPQSAGAHPGPASTDGAALSPRSPTRPWRCVTSIPIISLAGA
jgi:N-methylhydantoinase A